MPELPREGARRSAEARVEEAEGLAEAIGIEVVAARPFRVRTVRPATLLGKGQVEDIAEAARDNGAGLLIVSFARLRAVDPGFARDGIVTARVPRVPSGYDSAAVVGEFQRRVLERLRATPGGMR